MTASDTTPAATADRSESMVPADLCRVNIEAMVACAVHERAIARGGLLRSAWLALGRLLRDRRKALPEASETPFAGTLR